MNIPDDSELIKDLRDWATLCEDVYADILTSAANRITELRMVRTMLYQRLSELADESSQLKRRVVELNLMK